MAVWCLELPFFVHPCGRPRVLLRNWVALRTGTGTSGLRWPARSDSWQRHVCSTACVRIAARRTRSGTGARLGAAVCFGATCVAADDEAPHCLRLRAYGYVTTALALRFSSPTP